MREILIVFGRFFLALKDVWKDAEIRILFVLIILLLSTGAVFYSEVEKYDLIDALYYSVMIMSTIGYGELNLSTSTAKIFTIVYAFTSIGVFIALVSKIAIVFVERGKKSQKILKEWESNRKKHKRIKRKEKLFKFREKNP